MCKQILAFLQSWLDDESGQSITEYAYVIAFVGVLIAFAFNMAHNGFYGSLTQSYSACTSSLSSMNYAVSQQGT
jgi:Flp pilus assembly pilin Flp